MKFCEWLKKAREELSEGEILVASHPCGCKKCRHKLKPSPTTFYPPIEEKEK